jgi:ferredoxin
MEYKIIDQKSLSSWIDNLAGQTEVIGVKRKEGKYDFDKLANSRELELRYDVTVLPPSRYIFPPKETLLKFDTVEPKVEPVVGAKSQILVGVHPYDIKAIELLDEVFTKDNLDTNYIARRENTLIVGVDCLNPSPNAFCPSMGTFITDTGFDLHLTPIGDKYVVAIGTSKGGELLGRAKTKEAKDKDLKKRDEERDKAKGKYQLSLNLPPEDIPSLLDKSYDNPYWKEKAKDCLSCGSCIMVCPTCFCFDVQDDVELNLREGVRFRQWDGCMLADFAKIATGENFRGDRESRFRHRLYRKGKYVFERWGKLGCVGCGRCISACLAEIASPVEAFNTLKGG